MPPTPRLILAAAGVASLAAVAAGGAELVGAVRGQHWHAIGFDALSALAGVFGVLTALGRFRESHVLALFCAGLTMLVCTPLGFLASSQAEGLAVISRFLGAMAADPTSRILLIAGAVLVALSAILLLTRRPAASLAYLGRAALLGAPVAALAAAWMLSPGFRAGVQSKPPIVLAAIVFFAFFILCGLISASVHCFIRALEVGRAE